ncbi:MAG: (Fe-S)-binding protein, partial [Candidatus Bathyarchaeota archaeon]
MMNPDFITQHKIFSCIKCGRCVSSCPLTKSGETYSPMVMIEKTLLGFNILDDRETWLCLTCQACLKRCPSNVQLSAFIDAIRGTVARKKPSSKYVMCAQCGQPYITTPIKEYISKVNKDLELSEELIAL